MPIEGTLPPRKEPRAKRRGKHAEMMTLCYQFSQFKAAKVQTFNMVLKGSALRQLINEIRFFFGGRVLKSQLCASKLPKANSKIIFRLGGLHQPPVV